MKCGEQMRDQGALNRRDLLKLTALLAASVPGADWAASPPWPERPVKLIVPFSSGGPTDTLARLIADGLREKWGQPIVVDYKPGAGTLLGTQFVARAPRDGYTLGMATSALMINPALQSQMPFDTLRDISGVSQLAYTHYGIFAHPSVPFDDAAGLLEFARKNPGKLSYASPGVGTGTHLAGELLNRMGKIDLVHVPYKGSAPAQQDVLGGQVPLLFDVLFSAMPFVREKRLKPIALASPKRAAIAPDIGLISDAVPGFAALSYMGIIAPSGVPPNLLERISTDIAAVMRTPVVVNRFIQLGSDPLGSSSQEYNKAIASEFDKWSHLIKASGIKIE